MIWNFTHLNQLISIYLFFWTPIFSMIYFYNILFFIFSKLHDSYLVFFLVNYHYSTRSICAFSFMFWSVFWKYLVSLRQPWDGRVNIIEIDFADSIFAQLFALGEILLPLGEIKLLVALGLVGLQLNSLALRPAVLLENADGLGDEFRGTVGVVHVDFGLAVLYHFLCVV